MYILQYAFIARLVYNHKQIVKRPDRSNWTPVESGARYRQSSYTSSGVDLLTLPGIIKLPRPAFFFLQKAER